MSYSTLKRQLKPVSVTDKLCAFLFTKPLLQDEYCSIYSNWLDGCLDDIDMSSLEVDRCHLKFKTTKGVGVDLWVANYPYSYGNSTGYACPYERRGKYPSWKVILKLRKLQLSQKDKVLADYINSVTKEEK